ncbi:MAG: polysaccharide deacetylase family protein [Bacteroidota bacterium]
MINKVRSGIKRLKWWAQDLAFRSGIAHLPVDREVRRILVYHGLAPQLLPNLNGRFMTNAAFEEQAALLKQHGEVITFDQYMDGYQAKGKMTICLTFDDGYLNNFTELLPILEKYELPAVFYITGIIESPYSMLWPDMVDLYRHYGPETLEFNGNIYRKGKNQYQRSGGSLKHDLNQEGWATKEALYAQLEASVKENIQENDWYFWKQCNKEQLKALAEHPLITIGSHTQHHNCLGLIDLDAAFQEMKQSREWLEALTGKPVRSLAYPHGSYTRAVVDAGEQAGYDYQLAVDLLHPEDHQDPRVLPRICSNPYISAHNQLKAFYDGHY